MTINAERIRDLAQYILRELPVEPAEGLADVLAQIRTLARDVSHAPWYLSEPLESGEGYEFQTLGAHEPPHYEEMVAQFFPGNHGTAPGELIVLLLNNLEDLLAAAEKGLEK